MRFARTAALLGVAIVWWAIGPVVLLLVAGIGGIERLLLLLTRITKEIARHGFYARQRLLRWGRQQDRAFGFTIDECID